jgi:hypothetical protein
MAPIVYLIFHCENTFDKMIPHRIMQSFIPKKTLPLPYVTKPTHSYPAEPVDVTIDGEKTMHMIVWEHENHGMIEILDYAADRQSAEDKMNEMALKLPANLDKDGSMIEKPRWINSANLDLKQISLKVGRVWHLWEIEEFDLAQDKGQRPSDESKGYRG